MLTTSRIEDNLTGVAKKRPERPKQDELLSIREVAEDTGWSRQGILKMILRGDLHAVKVDTYYVIWKEDAEKVPKKGKA